MDDPAHELYVSPVPTRSNLVLAVLAMAQLVLQLDFSIVNVALPDIQRDLGFSSAGLQWIVTGYALTFGSLLLTGGRAGDLFGRRRLLIAGLVLFALSSLTCGLAQNPAMLVASRFMQGASGAFVAPTALSLLTTTFAEGPARQRALGIWQAAAAAGASAGVVVGGLLTSYTSWRVIFLVNVPIVAVLLVGVVRVLPRQTPTEGARLDYAGAGLASVGLGALIFGLSHGQQDGFTTPLTVAALVLAALLLALFVIVERIVPEPMLRFALLADPERRSSYLAMLLMGGVTAGYVYFVSLYLQRVRGLSPVATGVALLPATLTVMLTATFVTRRILKRLPVVTVLLAGMVFMAGGQFWLAQVNASSGYAAHVLPALLVMSFGMGLAFPSVAVGATARVAPGEQGVAGGLLTTSQQVGSAVGLALLATVAAARTNEAHGALVDGYRLAFGTASAIMLAAIVLTAITVRRAAHAGICLSSGATRLDTPADAGGNDQ